MGKRYDSSLKGDVVINIPDWHRLAGFVKWVKEAKRAFALCKKRSRVNLFLFLFGQKDYFIHYRKTSKHNR